jgi:Icc protein
MKSTDKITRRDALGYVGVTSLATAGLVAGPAKVVRSEEELQAADTSGRRKRRLRLVHLTDIHVQPEKCAEKGMIQCLHHAQSLRDKPHLILTGGDSVMDVMDHDAARANVQREIWQRVLRNGCSLPVEPCIGNHDVWGWNKQESKTSGKEPLWGKKWAMDLLGLDQRYRSFDRAGWHFVVLDSVFPQGSGYTARLDEAQFDWLAQDLAHTDRTTPVLLLSHIPILSAAAFLDGENEKTGDWHLPGSLMHIDLRRIKDLFLKHANVKLCLSGHLHLVDRVDYNGVTYLCNGAVSGAWWDGDQQECDEGYGLVDLYDDGTFERQYVSYGWQPA